MINLEQGETFKYTTTENCTVSPPLVAILFYQIGSHSQLIGIYFMASVTRMHTWPYSYYQQLISATRHIEGTYKLLLLYMYIAIIFTIVAILFPQRGDIALAITKCDMFDFLIDIVPREEILFKINKRQAAAGSVNSKVSNCFLLGSYYTMQRGRNFG